jgi:hypothetical protein
MIAPVTSGDAPLAIDRRYGYTFVDSTVRRAGPDAGRGPSL